MQKPSENSGIEIELSTLTILILPTLKLPTRSSLAYQKYFLIPKWAKV